MRKTGEPKPDTGPSIHTRYLVQQSTAMRTLDNANTAVARGTADDFDFALLDAYKAAGRVQWHAVEPGEKTKQTTLQG